MKAEVHGKVDPASTLPGDRMEDTLTDAVFSTLTYLPAEVFAAVLSRVLPASVRPTNLTEPLVQFWPSFPSGTEPDVVVTVAGWMVVFEAKYQSPFSTGEDDADHQLVREWADAWPVAQVQQLRGPIVVAVTADPAQPADIALARESVADLPDFAEDDLDPHDAVRWMSWQQIAAVIELCHPDLAPHEQTLVEDLFDFMERRGVRRMFEPFNPEDYWLINSANRVAAKRVFPAIATFADELLSHLDGQMKWGGGDQGIWNVRGLKRTSPTTWPFSYVMLPFWPVDWPPRSPTQAALVVMFNLREPRLEVGWLQDARTIGAATSHWGPLSGDLAQAFSEFGEDHLVALSAGDYARREQFRRTSDLDAAWLADSLSTLRSILVVRDIPIEDVVSTQAVADMLLEDKAAIDAHPVIFESLTAAGLLTSAA